MPTDQRIDAALRAVYAPPLYAGLTAGGEECGDPAYRRMPLSVTEPQGADVRFLANDREVRFGPWDFDAPQAFDAVIVVDGEGRTIESVELARPRRPMKADELIIRPGELRLGML